MAGGRTLGVVGVQSYEKNAFNEDHMRLLQGLSSSMGVAIASARLFDETQRLLKVSQDRAKELAILNSVGEAMANNPQRQNSHPHRRGQGARDIRHGSDRDSFTG
ncbi:GAF domain-containing protein [Mesorhizobium atlanticum]